MAASKPSKLSKSASTNLNSSISSKTQPSSSLSSHLAMVELKSRILAALAKLSDRDTYQIAVEDLEKMIRGLSADGVPMVLNALVHDSSFPSHGLQDPAGSKNASFLIARRETLRLLAFLCAAHTDAASAHLPKIIAHIARRVKDPASDSSVRDACRDAAGSLADLYLRPLLATAAQEDAAGATGGSSPVVTLFVKPLIEAMGEQNKAVQGGAAMCLAKVVECARCAGGEGEEEGMIASAGGAMFQRLCPRICKLLGSQSFLAKGALLSVLSSLAKVSLWTVLVGAISMQSMQQVLQSVCECLESSDWATRKAAADCLCVIASHSSHLISDGTPATIAVLEACRFDKVKPVRDSMTEALQAWTNIAGQIENVVSGDAKGMHSRNPDVSAKDETTYHKRSSPRKESESKSTSAGSPPTENDSISKGKGTNIPEKAVVMLKKKAPSLSDKELNPEFFQKLEKRSQNDFPVEVVVPRKFLQSSDSHNEDRSKATYINPMGTSNGTGAMFQESGDINAHNNLNYQNSVKRIRDHNKLQDLLDLTQDTGTDQRGFIEKESKARPISDVDRSEVVGDPSLGRVNVTRPDVHAEGSFMGNKSNWSAIQRQLTQLERQQSSLMNMLQDFMGGSHDSMVTLENRVRGLERVVEEMARDLTFSSGKRGGNMMHGFDRSPGRSLGKFNGLYDFSSSKFGRAGEGRLPFSERFYQSDNVASGMKGRSFSWRSESEAWDSYGQPRNGPMNSRRGYGTAPGDNRVPRTDHETNQFSGRRGWEKGSGPFRLGEGPSARSVWQASKDEATLEAIRVAGEDNGTSRTVARVAVPELEAEALTDENPGPDKGPLWASWTQAMDSLHAGDVDSAYAEILSTDDALLLVKLMDKSGPVFDQLCGEIAIEVLHAIGQFITEETLFDIALSWLQQLLDLLVENGADFLNIPLDWKREILLNLHEASALEPPEDWEGASPDQLMTHLASAWGLNLQQLIK
ncbi:hypothetical protein ZIOFF_030203 [Zingiber officinale]|uniref:Microtubule-associated protein TORTIFOLIA1 n=1 Tax=Zingiber officinale TaxID=94328 RepID=A0A8J5GZK0_ZINOF|nr:hypothetical protein ZIOFF_030203 [Zingiber officinale]